MGELVKPSLSQLRRERRIRTARLVFHTTAFIWFARVWLWHCSEEAKELPGARDFGWFFKYLTFVSYTLQTLTLAASVVDDLTKESPSQPTHMTRIADDCACAVFGFANAVTIVYHVLEAATHSMTEASSFRPPWLSSSTHVLNSVTAWLDLLISSPRSFSKASQGLSCSLIVVYLVWILICRQVNGRFPYPLLNKLPFPSGFLATAGFAVLCFVAFFQVGRAVSGLCRRVGNRLLMSRNTKQKII